MPLLQFEDDAALEALGNFPGLLLILYLQAT